MVFVYHTSGEIRYYQESGEGCRSGLTGAPGERVCLTTGTVGSNPTPSAIA